MVPKRVAVGVAAVAVAIALAGCGQVRNPVPPLAATTGPGAAHRPPPANKSATWRTVRRVLAEAPVLPGAHLAARPPVALLRKPMESIQSPNFLKATRWWTAPGTVSAALSYLRAHPPTGLHSSGGETLTWPDAAAKGVTFDGRQTGVYSQLSLVMAVARDGDGVAVRADAEALWLPGRSPAEHIAADVKSVAVTVRRPGSAPTLHRVVTGRHATALADVVNQLPVFPPGTYNCPMDRGFVDSLVFRVPGPDIAMQADITGCSTVSVTVDGRRQPELSDADRVDAAVLKALHLPSSYSR